MSNKKILIAYGTRFGSTEEVSEKLAVLFEKAGYESRLMNLRNIPEAQWSSPKDFDGVLVGSSIKRGQWTTEPKLYLGKYKEYLGDEIVLGIFISSGFAANPDRRPKVREDYIETVLDELGVQANMYDAFGGVIDFSKSSKMGWLDRKIIGLASKDNPDVKKNKRNDLRDWNQIRAFGEKFAELVRKRTKPKQQGV